MAAGVMDGYIRVSRVGGREGDAYKSPGIQRTEIEQWAKRTGVALGKVVVDEDVSGKKAASDRGLEQLIKRAESGASAGIIVYKIDRFGRDLADVAVNVQRLKKTGTRLVSATEGIDSSAELGSVFIGFLAGMGEYQWEMLKAGWARATTKAVEEDGIHLHGRHIPLGYRKRADKRLEPHPVAGPAVREAFKLKAGGASHNEVVQFLADKLGKRPAKSSVTAMLRNRVYLGEARGPYGATKANAHPALVDETTFFKVQARQGVKNAPTGAAATTRLRGIITCAHCGHKLRTQQSTNHKGDRVPSYVCAGRYAGGNCPSPASGDAAKVDKYVIEQLSLVWDEVGAGLEDAAQRHASAKAAYEQAQRAYDEWANDAEAYVRLGADQFKTTLYALDQHLEKVRNDFYGLDDPGLATTSTVVIDGQPFVYEEFGRDATRDRDYLASVIKSVTLAKADPKRRRWQPISERVQIDWVG